MLLAASARADSAFEPRQFSPLRRLHSSSPGTRSHLVGLGTTTFQDKMNEAMPKVWPKDGFGNPSDEISDRTPDLTQPGKFDPFDDPLHWRDIQNRFDATEGTSALLLSRYSLCWSFSQEQIHSLQNWGIAQLEPAMHTEQITSLVKTWLPTEDSILSSLSGAIRSGLQ